MPRSAWWGDWSFVRYNDHLSILDVLASKTLDFKTVGLLWLLMEQRTGLIVASRPVYAGKTTLLHSLLDFLPPHIEQYELKGFAEDFRFVTDHSSSQTYLVSEEISNHQYEYLWGHQAQKTFRLLPKGYRLGATIHARNAQEVAYVLHGYLEVPLNFVAHLGLVVALQAWNGPTYDDEPVRRVESVSLIGMDGDNLIAQTLAAREDLEGPFEYPSEAALRTVLESRFNLKVANAFDEVALREQALQRLYESRPHTRDEVRQAFADFYRDHHTA